MNSVPEQWKSGRLREFQARLLERMSAARDGSGMRDSRLGIMVGGRRRLLDLREASEIAHPMPVTKVPLTKDWYLGLASVRGNLIGIIDLDRFLGGAVQSPGKQSRIIVTSATLSVTSGFMVSRVMGLRDLQEMTLRQRCDGEEGDEGEVTDGGQVYLDGDGNDWTEISLAAIIEGPRFLHVGQ